MAQLSTVGVQTSVYIGTMDYGWDRHIWDTKIQWLQGEHLVELANQSVNRYREWEDVLVVVFILGILFLLHSTVIVMLLLSTGRTHQNQKIRLDASHLDGDIHRFTNSLYTDSCLHVFVR